MSIYDLKVEVDRLKKITSGICGVTHHNPAQHGLAMSLYKEIELLSIAIKQFEGEENPGLAASIGRDIREIAKRARALAYSHPSLEATKRLEWVFNILNRMPKEGARKGGPQIVEAFEQGLAA